MKKLSNSRIEGHYTSENNKLKLNCQVPEINYSGVQFDSLYISITGSGTKLTADLHLKKIAYDSNIYR